MAVRIWHYLNIRCKKTGPKEKEHNKNTIVFIYKLFIVYGKDYKGLEISLKVSVLIVQEKWGKREIRRNYYLEKNVFQRIEMQWEIQFLTTTRYSREIFRNQELSYYLPNKWFPCMTSSCKRKQSNLKDDFSFPTISLCWKMICLHLLQEFCHLCARLST